MESIGHARDGRLYDSLATAPTLLEYIQDVIPTKPWPPPVSLFDDLDQCDIEEESVLAVEAEPVPNCCALIPLSSLSAEHKWDALADKITEIGGSSETAAGDRCARWAMVLALLGWGFVPGVQVTEFSLVGYVFCQLLCVGCVIGAFVQARKQNGSIWVALWAFCFSVGWMIAAGLLFAVLSFMSPSYQDGF